MEHGRSRVAGGLFGAMSILLLFCSCSAQTEPRALPDAVRAKNAKVLLRDDQPGEAERLHAMKRQVYEGTTDVYSRYLGAARQMDAMKRYSLSLGRLVPSKRDADLAKQFSPLSPWQFLGPGNIGGRTRTILIDPRNANIFYAGGVSGGVWKSVNGGERWFAVGDLLPNLAVNVLRFDPESPDVIWAGTGEGYFREEVRFTGLPLRGAGIFVSRDAGITWTQVESTDGDDFNFVNDIEFSVNDPDRLYAATRTGVWRSKDEGATWERVLDPNVKGGCLDLAVRSDRNNDFVLAACGTLADSAVYQNQTAERTGSWTKVLAEPGMGRTSLAIAPSNPNVVYALSASSVKRPEEDVAGGLHALFRSDAGGDQDSWRAMIRRSDSNPIHANFLTNLIVAVQSDCFSDGSTNSSVAMGWYVNVIAVDPRDAERVWAGGVDLMRSDDGGETWGPASYWWSDDVQSFAHADKHAIVFHPGFDGVGNQTMYVGTDGGVVKTDNANAEIGFIFNAVCDPTFSKVRFETMNNGFGITQFYHGAVSPDGSFVIAGAQDNGTLFGFVSLPDQYLRIWGGDGGYCAIDPTNKNIMFAESQNGRIVKSTNKGARFIQATNGIEDSFLFIPPFIMDSSNSSRLWTGGQRMWRTTNGASSWAQASSTLNGLVNAIAVSPSDPDSVMAGLHNGSIHRTTRALSAGRSTNWPVVTPRMGFVTSLAYDPGNETIGYATYGGFGGGAHVWRTEDGGATWTSIDGIGEGLLPDIPVHSIVVDPSYPSRLFLGTDLGVFVSSDAGRTWAPEADLPRAVTEWIVLQTDTDKHLYAFTHGRGIWRAKVEPLERRRPTRR